MILNHKRDNVRIDRLVKKKCIHFNLPCPTASVQFVCYPAYHPAITWYIIVLAAKAYVHHKPFWLG